MYDDKPRISMRKLFGLIFAGVLSIVLLISIGSLVENVDADEIMVIQDPMDGELHWYTSAGMKWQGFGKVTSYPRRSEYSFSQSVKFNDGGHGTIWGSTQWEMPQSDSLLNQLHSKYPGVARIQEQIIQTVTNKSIYMTGPLMSSRESYAERRNDLIRFVEDQIENGVYRTRSRDIRVVDPISGQEKTAIVVEIVNGPDGLPARQEASVVKQFGIRTFNFSIDSIPYDKTVEDQIAEQQKLAMQIQTSIAQARQAEQRRITAQANGEALAAEARWKQEAVRAESVTVYQRRLDQARLDAQAAEQYKKAEILRGEGDATRRRLVMQADGALTQKIDAWVRINQSYAENFSKYTGQWVPSVVMGRDGASGSGSGAADFMSLLTAQSARQLGLDLAVPRGAGEGRQAQPARSNSNNPR